MPNQQKPKTLNEALIEFKKNAPKLINTKTEHNYSYLPLEMTLDQLNPVLLEYGLFVSQPFGVTPQGQPTVITILRHVSGEEIKGEIPLFIPMLPETTPQHKQMFAWGGAITYARRYSLKSILGLECDNDDPETEDKKPQQRQGLRPSRPTRGTGISRSPSGLNKKTEPPKTSQKKEESIDPKVLDQIKVRLADPHLSADNKNHAKKLYKAKFNISSENLAPSHIQTKEQGDYMSQLLDQYQSA